MPKHSKMHHSKKHKKSQSKSHSGIPTNSNRLLNLFTTISDSRKDIPKMHNNLPARLLQLNTGNSISSNQVYGKSISSTYSSVMHNGHTHTQGKQIINETNKPFLQVQEMIDGQTQQYLIPKNRIPYKPSKLFLNISKPIMSNKSNKSNKSKSKTIKKVIVHSSKPKKTTKQIFLQ